MQKKICRRCTRARNGDHVVWQRGCLDTDAATSMRKRRTEASLCMTLEFFGHVAALLSLHHTTGWPLRRLMVGQRKASAESAGSAFLVSVAPI